MSAALPPPALASLVQFEQQVRAADSMAALGFVMVNDTRRLLPYRQAMLWDAREQRLLSLSGLATVEADAPFNHWLCGRCRDWQQQHPGPKLAQLNASQLNAADQAQWAEYLPSWLIWLPLADRQGQCLGALLLGRDQPLDGHEASVLAVLQDTCGHAWASLQPASATRLRRLRRDRRWWLGGAAAALVILLLPIRQAALAPAEIVALQPSVLRAPLQGVVERLLVEPNETVNAGQPLIQLDARELQSRLEASRQAMAEVRYLEQSLERTRILAPHDGVALFDDPAQWQGRPVSLGEQIMQVADPARTQLEIQLPVSDAIELHTGADVLLFLNTDPAAPLPGTLKRLGYRATASAEGTMAYRLKAAFSEPDPRIRIGLKGTAKVYGERTTLFTYLLRRPLATLRIWLAL